MSHTQAVSSIGRDPRPVAESNQSIVSPAGPTVGIVYDLGNLIQIASSAVNIVARYPSVYAADLGPVIAGAKTSLERAGTLVRQTISKARELDAAAAQTNVAVSLAEVEMLLQGTWERSFRLDVRVAPDLPAVKCDRLALQNAVLNLIYNARDAMPDGGVIAIRAGAIPMESGEGIELAVIDGGIGMKPDTISRAFEPFFTTKCDGLGGIGLKMVERFVQELGGRVIVESEFGVGTTVTLQLPAPSRNTDARPAQASC